VGDFLYEYDVIFIDGDHSPEEVESDIKKSLLFNPKYILFDDVLHPSHSHIHSLITWKYSHVLEVGKMYEFHQCWKGYSFALCKNKNHK
jgi:hypothetical protein